MMEYRPFASLGAADHGWLDARHHFSFAGYHDPQRMHWGRLRVWNDDTIQPRTGFPLHPHADMEIITYVREGAITHEDSLGNKGRTVAGDVQVMSAGTGIRHSEYNLESGPTRLFQIWILPDARGHAPSWGTQPFPREARSGRWVVLASGVDDDENALRIHSPARVLGATLKAGETLAFEFSRDRPLGYLVPATGRVTVNNLALNARDGLAISDEGRLTIIAREDAELVLVETA